MAIHHAEFNSNTVANIENPWKHPQGSPKKGKQTDPTLETK